MNEPSMIHEKEDNHFRISMVTSTPQDFKSDVSEEEEELSSTLDDSYIAINSTKSSVHDAIANCNRIPEHLSSIDDSYFEDADKISSVKYGKEDHSQLCDSKPQSFADSHCTDTSSVSDFEGDQDCVVDGINDDLSSSILKHSPAMKIGNMRIPEKNRRQNLFPLQKTRNTMNMHGYTVLVTTYIQNLEVPAIFDTGASSTVISPHVISRLHQKPEVLPFDKSYGGVCPQTKLLSQGVIPLSFQIGKEVYNYRAVVADIDCPFIIGADFMNDFQTTIKFTPKGGKVQVESNGSSFPLRVVKKFLAQWVKTKVTETLEPREERIVPIRMTNYLHRDKPSIGQGGLVEPSTALRAKGVLVPYSYLLAGQESYITLYNTSDETVLIDAGTIIGHWTPAKVITKTSLNLPEDVGQDSHTFDPAVSKYEQGYESESEEHVKEDDIIHSTECAPKLSIITSRSGSKDVPLYLEELVKKSDLNQDSKKTALRNLLKEYRDVMVDPKSPLGRTRMVEHCIDTGDARPIRQVVRPPAKSLAGASEAEVQRMLDEGLIRPSDSPWASPVVLVRKKDGSVRFCVDYRKLNEVTRKDAYPLPRIDSCFDCLGRSTWFCTLDLRSGYWQVPVSESDIEKTAFITPQGLFEYLVMPFGLTNAPATFERLMERVLKGLQWKRCLVYIDDIIVFGSTFEETLDNLRQVLQRLRQAKLTCKPTKCELFKRKVSFLGHIVSSKGLECDPEKTRTVASWPTPRTVKDIRSFLGLAGYYRRFIPNFAEYSAPLTELTKVQVPFKWTERQETAFQHLKTSLCNPPVLSYPTDTGMYILDTDASNFGIGAVLSQLQGSDSEEKVIAYASKTLQGAQRTYCTTKKELYAMVYFVKHFRHYLVGRRFLVRTDHASLLWLLNFKNPEGILARWLMTLSAYMPFDYIAHRPGKLHANADAMSRVPVSEQENIKKCPKTYTNCPSCYPGAVTIDMDSGEKDATLVVAQAQEHLFACREAAASILPMETSRRTSPRRRRKPSEQSEPSSSSSSSSLPSKDGNEPQCRANFQIWSLGWDTPYLRRTQNEDPDIGIVLRRKKDHDQPPPKDLSRRESHALKTLWSHWHALIIIDGLLYRRYRLENAQDPILQLVLPRKLRNRVLRYAHDNPLAAHRGQHGTISTLRQRFYWPTYRKDAKLYVMSCEKCQKSKPKEPGRAPLTQTASGEPMECCAMDLLGPFEPPTDSGNRYILVIGDTFSKWVEAYAIPNKEAKTVAERLSDFFCRFGIPQRIHSDRGLEFHNQVLEEMAKLLHIQPSFTTAYRPQSNGMIERFNRTLIKMLKTFVDDFAHATTWDTLLPMLTGAYRATEHSSTGCTPNLLFMGREVSIPLDLLAGSPPRQRTFYNAASYGQWLTRAMNIAHEYARNTLNKSAVRQKRNYDARTKTRKWTPTIGEWVYFYYPPYGRYKLGSPWTGPYVVVKELRARTWLIQAAPDRPARVVHEDNLKPCMDAYKKRTTGFVNVLQKTLQPQYQMTPTSHLKTRTRKNPTLPDAILALTDRIYHLFDDRTRLIALISRHYQLLPNLLQYPLWKTHSLCQRNL